VNINHLEYSDFTGDGMDEAVVVASGCATATAGPDVQTVLSRCLPASPSPILPIAHGAIGLRNNAGHCRRECIYLTSVL
jgi:hypothetical protein